MRLERGFERCGSRFAITAQEDIDTLLGSLEGALAMARELHAALEAAQRLIERQITVLERLDELFELGERLLEVWRLGIARHVPPGRSDAREGISSRRAVNAG